MLDIGGVLMPRHPRATAHDDAGFTLIELIVATAILGIVMVALTTMMFSALTTDSSTAARLDSSRTEQFAATYFADDVQGANAAGGIVVPGVAPCNGTGTPVVEFVSTSFDTTTLATQQTLVGYVVVNTTVNGVAATELHRLSCAAGSSTPDDVTAARALAAAAPLVSVTGRTVTITLTPLQGSAFSLVGTRRTT
jgi:prepilin-type N-terminal cleavage/methylation domain-containing protein